MNEAARYYERRSPGLGTAFVAEVERCTAAIVEHPEMSPIVMGTIRWRLIQRFPYGLLYRVRPEHVHILAVMNLKRRPAYWIGRI